MSSEDGLWNARLGQGKVEGWQRKNRELVGSWYEKEKEQRLPRAAVELLGFYCLYTL